LSLVSDEDSDTALRILREVSAAEPEVSSDRRTLSVTVGDGPAALQSVLVEIKEYGIRLHDAGMRRPTLDDVFLQLTGHAATLEVEEAKKS
jgi:ABC-2 type transport system ATP-binding protein